MKPLLLVMNPREIPRAMEAISALKIDKVWLKRYWEKELEEIIERIVQDAEAKGYTHLLLLSDDTVPSQSALDAVLKYLSSHPVVTGYCNLDSVLPYVNLTKEPFQFDNESHANDYKWFTRAEVESSTTDLIKTQFTGACLTGMSIELWKRFPFQVLSRPDAPLGYASDWKLSIRLQKAAVPIVAVKGAFVEHLKTLWLEGPAQDMKKDPNFRLLMGEKPSEIVWDVNGEISSDVKIREPFNPIKYWEDAGRDLKSPEHESRFVKNNIFKNQEIKLIEVLDSLEFNSILEIGCGFGRITKLLAERYPHATIDAIDISEDRLKSARNKVPENKNVNFYQTTIQEFNRPRNNLQKWDLVISVECLMHIPPVDISNVIEKMFQLSNGHIVTLDWSVPLNEGTPIAEHNRLHDYSYYFGDHLSWTEQIGLQSIYHAHTLFDEAARYKRLHQTTQLSKSHERDYKICLTMIVKNESKVIARCLNSVKPFIDSYVIVDTGSTDNTAEIIQNILSDLPGMVVKSEWKGFGASRTEAFNRALDHTKEEIKQGIKWFGLVLDADELVLGDLPNKFVSPVYSVWLQMGHTKYRQCRLFELSLDWRYVGVLHEFPTCDGVWSDISLNDFIITSTRDGARSTSPLKYEKDAEVFEDALLQMEKLNGSADELLKTRYVFYLAQSYRDAGNNQKSLENYLKRAQMGAGYNWEEIYISYLEAARCYERLGQIYEADKTYLLAHHTWPQRPEAPRALARIFKYRVEQSKPVGSLFLEMA